MKNRKFNYFAIAVNLIGVAVINTYAADGNFVNLTATTTGLPTIDANHTLTVTAQSYGPGYGPVYVKTLNTGGTLGSGFNFLGVDAGIRAENVTGNGFSAAIAAYSGLGWNESVALIAAKQDGTNAAKLSYRDATGYLWAGHFNNKVLITAPTWTTGSEAILGLGDNGPSHFIKAGYGKGMTIQTYGTNCYIRLQEVTGYVGIGMEPAANKGKLQVAGDTRVDGKIYCKELSVLTNVWADYVFKPEYKLAPLSEVESYIAKNKHLPGMPPQEEAMKKGVDVGKMQVKMLEKIEELTLHMIEQNKKIEELTKANEELTLKVMGKY